MSCVNQVGVDVNTASRELLAYVSGVGALLATNIIKHRKEKGPFRSRNELREVPRLGPMAFEQAAGFLRIRNGTNPIDNTAVHPESYKVVEKMAAHLNLSIEELIRNTEARKTLNPALFTDARVGFPTINDILRELDKPGRDPRTAFEVFEFDKNVQKITDLQPGMELNGVVTNITAFGAFVDIGVHQDGLVHISQIADEFVSDINAYISLNQKVRVKVLQVEPDRKRIQLTLRGVKAYV